MMSAREMEMVLCVDIAGKRGGGGGIFFISMCVGFKQ